MIWPIGAAPSTRQSKSLSSGLIVGRSLEQPTILHRPSAGRKWLIAGPVTGSDHRQSDAAKSAPLWTEFIPRHGCAVRHVQAWPQRLAGEGCDQWQIPAIAVRQKFDIADG